jgi:hypothetical protein
MGIRIGQLTVMKLRQTVFHDSDIVKKLFCRRTKAEDIATGIVAPASVNDSLQILHTHMLELEEKGLTPFFQLQSDASNHCSFTAFPSTINCRTP